MRRLSGLFICLLALPLWATRTPFMRHLGTPDGLPDLLVNVIHRDTTGLIWLGTGSSVELFDGVRFTHFPLPGSKNFNQRVNAIVGQSSSQIFVGNNNGLYTLSPNSSIRRFADSPTTARLEWQRVGEGEIMGSVSDLCLSNETLYVATDHGLYSVTNRQPSTITHHPLHPNDLNAANQLRHICMDSDGILWMTSSVGLHALLPNRQISHYHYPNLPEGGFNHICYKNDTILLGTFHSGVYYFAVSSATFGVYYATTQPVSALQPVGNDTLFIATDGGGVLCLSATDSPLHRFNVSTIPDLSSYNVYSMLYDEEGLLWVGYYQQGLDYTVHQHDLVHVYQTPTFDSYGHAVRALATHDMYKLIGTRDGLYLVNEQTHQLTTYNQRQLNAQMIFALCYHRDRFYVGTFGGGLYTLSPDAPIHRFPNTTTIGSQIFCLTPDSSGHLWVGSEKGAFVLEGERIIQRFESGSSSLPMGNVYTIFLDRMGRVWLCTQSGMAVYDSEQQTVRTDIFPSSFPSQQTIRSIYQDADGLLYFLPDKGQLFVCDEHLRPVSVNIPLVEALFLTKDSLENLWIGTTNGLYVLATGSSTHPFTDSPRYFDFASGLPDNTFTLCQPYWAEDGTLYMGHSRGLVFLHPDSLTFPHSHLPRVIDVQQQGGDVTFLFSDLSYTLPQYVHYAYQLKGYETEWHVLNGISQCTYSNLPMGRYTLLLRNNNCPDLEYTYTLRVPMSKQNWLILGIVLLSVIIIILLVLYLIHRYRYHPKPVEETPTPSEVAYRTFHLSDSRLKALSRQFCQVVADNKLYLNPTIRIASVAELMHTSSYSLSYMLNQYMHVNFNDYINHLRIETFCHRVQQGDAKRYSIDTLASECGFVSRAGFFRNFKKQMLQTPNEYIQSLNN